MTAQIIIYPKCLPIILPINSLHILHTFLPRIFHATSAFTSLTPRLPCPQLAHFIATSALESPPTPFNYLSIQKRLLFLLATQNADKTPPPPSQLNAETRHDDHLGWNDWGSDKCDFWCGRDKETIMIEPLPLLNLANTLPLPRMYKSSASTPLSVSSIPHTTFPPTTSLLSPPCFLVLLVFE